MKVKICCISSIDEAQMAISAGAGAIGLVADMPSGPGVIPKDLISEISAWAAGKVERFLLTSAQDADRIIAQQQRCKVDTLQLCDTLPLEAYARLRAALPNIRLVQVIHVTGPASLEEALAVAPHVDTMLLDSGNPSLAKKELGGTGRVHNWNLSARITGTSTVPVYLAGGLNSGNVAGAIETANPQGVDVCSGVRAGGRLDGKKLADFMGAVRAATPAKTASIT